MPKITNLSENECKNTVIKLIQEFCDPSGQQDAQLAEELRQYSPEILTMINNSADVVWEGLDVELAQDRKNRLQWMIYEIQEGRR